MQSADLCGGGGRRRRIACKDLIWSTIEDYILRCLGRNIADV